MIVIFWSRATTSLVAYWQETLLYLQGRSPGFKYDMSHNDPGGLQGQYEIH